MQKRPRLVFVQLPLVSTEEGPLLADISSHNVLDTAAVMLAGPR
jgi:hypothetical protein